MRLRTGEVEWRQVDDEMVALDVNAAEYLTANRTGTCLWAALANETDRAGLVAALVARFKVDEERAAADVDRFLDDLRARNLLEE